VSLTLPLHASLALQGWLARLDVTGCATTSQLLTWLDTRALHADDYPDEEVFFHDLADGTPQVKLVFLNSSNRTLTLPPVTWVDRPPRGSKLYLPET
jgi:hypothetical protein